MCVVLLGPYMLENKRGGLFYDVAISRTQLLLGTKKTLYVFSANVINTE